MSGAKIIKGLHQAVEYELRQTIAALEKRIAELEAQLKETIASSDRVCDSYAAENQRFHDALTTERQRREEAEATIRGIMWSLCNINPDATDLAKAYFTRYASEGKP
jgi:septal ring factor EnvC (AmiA/AmiB activator)